MALASIIENAREKFSALILKQKMGGEAVRVKIGPLSAEQAIGSPGRDDQDGPYVGTGN